MPIDWISLPKKNALDEAAASLVGIQEFDAAWLAVIKDMQRWHGKMNEWSGKAIILAKC